MSSRGLAATFLMVLPVATAHAQTLIWPGSDVATIDAAHLRAYVPAGAVGPLLEKVARADQIYGHMIADAGFVPGDKLRLLLWDWSDGHNGYSFVTPFPLVQVQLAPSQPDSTIFVGGLDLERTLIHEFAHQISNDRNAGVRGVLESVFGRVLPNDLLSTFVFYLSTPAHQTMPRFWQEGLGVWAETSYADPASVWAGRGRDPLTHMIWRLDAAGGEIPDVSEWRITQHQWPFGGLAYTYGTAYTRFLEGYFGDRASVWQFVAQQARSWAFLFDRAPRRLVGQRHQDLMLHARSALREEQRRALAQLRTAPVTATERLTPLDMRVGAPAWRADGSLVFGGWPAQDRGRQHTLSADGGLHGSFTPTRALGAMRALPDGGEVYHEYNWRGISRLVIDGATVGWRTLQPDASAASDGARTVVAIQLRDGGGQDLVVHRFADGDLDAGRVLPTEGTPWTPALRPGHADELVWVETDAAGSRLVLGSLRDPAQRRELWRVRGRILHPCWTADGAQLFCCSDVTRVANAYRLTPGDDGVQVEPVTNVIGGVLACVPSPDGSTLALIDHDARGPFVCKLANDPASYAQQVPSIELAWPAPVAGAAATAAAASLHRTPIPPLPAGAAAQLQAEPYSGIGEVRPRFWAPSTLAVPSGGIGVYGFASDPLLTHVVQSGVGAGLVEQEPVAFASWDYLGSALEFGVNGGRSERTFADTVTLGTELFDYTETVAHGEVRVGRGLFALETAFLCYASVGIESHDEPNDVARRLAGRSFVGNKQPFQDTERYAEFVVGFDNSTFYPTSYTREDGIRAVAVFRHSGLGGDLERNLALFDGGYTLSLLPRAGHQLVVRGQLGWSDGDDTLQGNFSVGGGLGTGLPRGYLNEAVATGRHLLGGSLAYRFPVWRPFVASSTTPFRGRQVVVELFGDTAKISNDRLNGNGDWFTSVGFELFANAEFYDGLLSPGVGVAWQLDGERDVRAYFTLGFSF